MYLFNSEILKYGASWRTLHRPVTTAIIVVIGNNQLRKFLNLNRMKLLNADTVFFQNLTFR